MEGIISLDTQLFKVINGLSATSWIDLLMLGLSSRGLWFAVILAFLIFFSVRKSWRMVRVAVIATALMGLCDATTSYGLKNNIQRLRPCHALEDVRLVQESCGSKFGFPSNHAANGMSLLVSMHLLLKRRRVSFLILILVSLVGYSRIHLGVHYPLDITFGWLFGALVSWTGISILRKFKPDWVTVPR